MPRALLMMVFLVLSACGGDATRQQVARLPNGVYEVVASDYEAAKLHVVPGTRAIVFDRQFVRGGSELPVRHVLLRLDGYAPLDLAEPPTEAQVDDRPVLWITLKPTAGRALTELTTRVQHVAIVVGGNITTTHTVREPLVGGKLQISC